jgi:hypothetical protein
VNLVATAVAVAPVPLVEMAVQAETAATADH